MSKRWKIVIAVVAALAVVAIAGMGGYMAGQGWTPGTFTQRQSQAHPLEARLKDDNRDWAPDRGEVDRPAGPALGRGFEHGAGPGARTDQLPVRLIDDNKDGIPDRGVIDLSPQGTFNSDFGPGYDRDFGPARDRPFRLPFLFFGGLIGLAGLALLISLAIFFYRRRQPTLPIAPVGASPAPAEVQPAPDEVQPTPDEVQPAPDEVQPAPAEVQPTPDEVQPTPDEVQPTPDESQLEPPVTGESTGDESNEEAVDNIL